MRRVTLRGLLARKLRLALTALAIVLGVTFVTGTLVLGDTLNRTFNNLIGTAYQHVSFEIRGKAAFSEQHGAARQRHRRPQAGPAVDRRRGRARCPGVAYVDGSVSGYAQFVAPRRQRDRQRRRLDARVLVRPQPRSSRRYRLVAGHAPRRPPTTW